MRILKDLKETCLASWDEYMLTNSMVWDGEPFDKSVAGSKNFLVLAN